MGAERDASGGEPDQSRAGEPALRIAGVDPERGFGGGETQVLGLTRALLRAGHGAELLCDPAGALWVRAHSAGVICHTLQIRNSVDLGAGLRLRALLRRRHYDIVHFHTARAHALAPYARGRAGALIVTRRMDYVPNRLFAPWLFNRAVDGVAAISEGVVSALAQAGVGGERVMVIPSGVDCELFVPPDPRTRAEARQRIGAGPADVLAGVVAALTPRKGHDQLLRAMAQANATLGARRKLAGDGRLRCFIAGAGPSRETIAATISEHGLDDCVSVMGPVHDPRTLLRALDVFVMPSRMEGLGVAVLEAMACGLPVIACAVGGLREVVEHEHTGLLVALDDTTAMAEALVRLALAPALRAGMGVAGREIAVARFGMERMAQRTLELYRAALAGAHGSGRPE
jgi:glycosyltransferase involved in cell wall biosynthesis